MFLEERHSKIIELVHQNGKVAVKELSHHFGISESMIRKDLQALEKQHKLKRTYGGAIRLERTLKAENDAMVYRVETNLAAKMKIVEKAVQLVKSGDIIFLDAASTSFLLAKELLASDLKITIITNMPSIISMARADFYQDIILIGGDYNATVGATIGSHAIEQIFNYRCNKAFIGCIGINVEQNALTASNSEDSHTKKAIMQISKHNYLCVPHDYFSQDGLYTFSTISDFDKILVDEMPSEKILEDLKSLDTEII